MPPVEVVETTDGDGAVEVSTGVAPAGTIESVTTETILPGADAEVMMSGTPLRRHLLFRIPGAEPGGSFAYEQITPATTWTVDHNLGFYPNATLVDSAREQFLAHLSYPNVNTVVVTLDAAQAGFVYLS